MCMSLCQEEGTGKVERRKSAKRLIFGLLPKLHAELARPQALNCLLRQGRPAQGPQISAEAGQQMVL